MTIGSLFLICLLRGDVPPSYSQVAGESSQSVWVTPLCQPIRELSVDSGESSAMAAAGIPNMVGMTVAQFDQYYNGLQNDPARIAAETQALQQGSDAVRISVLLKRDNRNHQDMANMQGQGGRCSASCSAGSAASCYCCCGSGCPSGCLPPG